MLPSKTKTVLLLSHFYPPHDNVASRLNASLSLIMLRNGITPIVVCADTGFSKDKVDQSLIEAVKEISQERYPWSWPSKGRLHLQSLLKMPSNPLFFGSSKAILCAGEKAVKENHIDIIYSVAIADAHVAAMSLASKYHLPVVVEFQDPWLDNVSLMKYMYDQSIAPYYWAFKKMIGKKLKDIISSAYLVVTESAGHRDALRERCEGWRIKSDHILAAYLGAYSPPERGGREADGVCSPLLPRIQKNSPLLSMLRELSVPTIGFVGSLYYGYKHRAKEFVRVMAELERQGERFCFVCVSDEQIPKWCIEQGLTQIFSLQRLPFIESINVMGALDMGLAIPSSPININTKFFDYVQSGCRVLVWGEPQGEMAQLVRRQGGGMAIGEDDTDRVILLRNFLADSFMQRKQSVPDEQNQWWRREVHLAPVIERIMNLKRQLPSIVAQASSL